PGRRRRGSGRVVEVPDSDRGAPWGCDEMELRDWFLTATERGNTWTSIDASHGDGTAWTTGNRVRPLIHGATYFAELLAAVRAAGAGDHLFFTDWRGDPDERLGGSGTEVGGVLAGGAARGGGVRGRPAGSWYADVGGAHIWTRSPTTRAGTGCSARRFRPPVASACWTCGY